MRNTKFARTAAGVLALCVLMLTGCEKENENTVSETEASATAETYESVTTAAETTAAETVTAAETAPKEYEPVPKSTLNYDKVKDRVIFSDGENTLTAGQFIDALESCEEFDDILGHYYIFQTMDIDGNGIPEIVLARDDTTFVCSKLFTVTAEGEAMPIKTVNHDICNCYNIDPSADHYQLRGGSLTPYEKDGETVWLSGYNSGGAGAGASGTYILKYDGNVIDGDIVRHSSYERYPVDEEWMWDYNSYYNVLGEDVTEEEYDLKYEEYLNGLQPSEAVYTQGYIDICGDHGKYDRDKFKEMFCYTLNRYLDMREGADKNPYDALVGKTIGDVPAQEYVDAMIACGELTEGNSKFQLADLNGDGMPEVIAYDDMHSLNDAKFYSLSPDKKAALIPVKKNKLNEQLSEFEDRQRPNTLVGKWVRAYKNGGETVWTGNFTFWDKNVHDIQGDVILKYDGRTVSQEILREHEQISYETHKYYWRGEETDEGEYERLYREFIWNMEPLPEINLYSARYDCNRDRSQKELLSAAVLEYLKAGLEQSASSAVFYDDGTYRLTAEQFSSAFENCEEFTAFKDIFCVQIADISGDGIPEVILTIGDFDRNTTEIFSADKTGAISKINVDFDRSLNHFIPYEKDGETVWTVSADGLHSKALMRLSGNTVSFEEICRNIDYEKFFWRGKEVSRAEYEKLKEEFYGEMNSSALPCSRLYSGQGLEGFRLFLFALEDYVEVMPYTYDKIKNTVICSDGKNVLTAGQYIDALINCEDFVHLYKNGIQLADLNGDGIPEAIAQTAAFPITAYFAVSPEGNAAKLYDKNGESEICAGMPVPYEKDGGIVWVSEFYVGGSVSGGGGDCIITYEDGKIKKEILRCYDYSKDLNTFEYYYTYYWGSDGYWDNTKGVKISEEEYNSRFEDLLAGMKPAERLREGVHVYGGDTYSFCELAEVLADMMKEYIF